MPKINLDDLKDCEIASLFRDDSKVLKQRVKAILEDKSNMFATPPIDSESGSGEAIQTLRSDTPKLAGSQVTGMYFAVISKGDGHHDPCYGRFSTQIGGRNYGYTGYQPIGDLLAQGDNRIGLEIWTPWYASPTGVSYHTRVEFFADPVIWNPGGVLGWAESFGQLGFETEHKIFGHEFAFRIN